jgi:4-amino-4-deoxy-L-arabinose transferase-like glycosyltransferase
MWLISMALFPVLKDYWGAYGAVALGLGGAVLLLRPSVRRRVLDGLGRWSVGQFLLGIVVVSLVLRGGVMLLRTPTLYSDSKYYHALAVGLLGGEGYGETAYLPPGFPAVLAGWYALTGAYSVAGFLMNVLIATAAVAVVYDLGRQTAGERPARVATLIVAVMPSLVLSASHLHTTSLLVLLSAGAIDLTVRAARPGGRGYLVAAGLGLLLGAAALVRPVFLLVPALCFVSWLVWGERLTALAKTALCCVVMAATVAPWTIRNHFVLDAFVPVSTNGGYVLYNGMNPETYGTWSRREPVPGEQDELSRDRLRRAAALRWMRENPLRCVRLMVLKQAFMWGRSGTSLGAGSLADWVPEGLRRPGVLALEGLALVFWAGLFGLCGWAALRGRGWTHPKLVPALLYVYLLFGVHLFFEVQPRYHLPALPALALIAAAGYDKVRGDSPQPARRVS